MRYLYCLLFLSLLGCQTEPSWSEKTLADLTWVRDRLRESHPAAVLREAPHREQFRDWLRSGYEIGRKRAALVENEVGYYLTLRAFAQGFNDQHLSVLPQSSSRYKEIASFRAPQVTIGFRKGEVKVVESRSDQVKVGSKLISCDGEDIKDRLRKELFPFYGNPDLEATWYLHTAIFFRDGGNPFRKLPQKCEFLVDGNRVQMELKFEPVEFDKWYKRYESAAQVVQSRARISAVGSGLWVVLPTFYPNEKQQKVYRHLIRGAKHLLKGKSFVVFDVRGNFGGSSRWGAEVLDSVFGEGYMRKLRQKLPSMTYTYRVSPGNIEYFEEHVRRHQAEFGSAPYFEKVVMGLKQGLKSGERFFETEIRPSSELPEDTDRRFRGRVFVLTDYSCASACLSFLDEIKLIPGAVQVGKETSADSFFMESRFFNHLPHSERFTFSFPVMEVTGRQRGHNEPHRPRIPYRGAMSDLGKIKKWFTERIVR